MSADRSVAQDPTDAGLETCDTVDLAVRATHLGNTPSTLSPEGRSPSRQALRNAKKHAGSEIGAPQHRTRRGQCQDAAPGLASAYFAIGNRQHLQ
jgi:hypothetical protein